MLCHDYSVGTNRQVPTAAFSMTSVWDVRPVLKESSFLAKYDIRDGFWHMPIGEDSKKRLVVRHPGTGRLIWASRLPFGYLEAPRLFCGLTEALCARLRKKAAGRGIHYFVFVDDILVVGDTEALTAEGMGLLEEEFAARGVQWAPHKKRGPCQCIEFLGLLICNMRDQRGITITRKRRGKLEAEMNAWSLLQNGDEPVEADPRELASFLGKLVFCSQVVKGGRTYMQGMLAQFQGLVVDWRRGEVSAAGGRWRKMVLTSSFWRDLAWWRLHLRHRSLAPLEPEPARAEAALTGTDASGWGTGQIAWLDGGREESVLHFTAAEKRRPINWRELLGVLRICLVWGHRLRGRVVLVETDNMAAYGASRKMASKASDMQELIRRLYRAAEHYGFTLRVSHTPGEKLDRPDQTSRGDAMEEPRARLRPGLFGLAERRFGAFTSLLGAEREIVTPGAAGSRPGTGRRLWLHPTVSTVGTALRRVQEEMVQGGIGGTTALALIPDDDAPAWATLMRHGLTVGRLPAGAAALDMNVLGQWRKSTTNRPMRFVLFPRAAGAFTKKVTFTREEGEQMVMAPEGGGRFRQTTASEGYVLSVDRQSFRLPLLPGSYVYSLPKGEGWGGLYRVEGFEEVEPRDGEMDADITARFACLDMGKAARKKAAGKSVFSFDMWASTHAPDPDELWVVDHLVEKAVGTPRYEKVTFDFERANHEIRRSGGEWKDPREDWAGQPRRAPWTGRWSDRPLFTPDGDRVRDVQASASTPAGSTPTPSDVSGYSPFRSLPDSQLQPASGGFAESLEQAAEGLDATHMAASGMKRGAEGRVVRREFAVRDESAQAPTGSRASTQPCPYPEIRCGGCGGTFALGQPMRSSGNSVTHVDEKCKAAHEAWMELEAATETAQASRPTVYYAVFTLELGCSGIYTDYAEVDRLVGADQVTRYGARHAEFLTHAEASRFVLECSHEAIDERPGARDGSSKTVKEAQLEAVVSEARIGRVSRCISGHCGVAHDVSNATKCRSGCGRMLHVATCAQLGKGFAALGNFTCVECRLIEVMAEPDEASDIARKMVARTMLLELSQGAESTSASFAEYVRYEQEYVSGMGAILDSGVSGGGMHLPRHNVEAFKNFLTWFVIAAGRAQSLESMYRSAGAFFTKLKIIDLTKDGSVKAHKNELLSSVDTTPETATAATPRMLKAIVGDPQRDLLAVRFADPFVAARGRVQMVLEGVGGCRIGEVAGGGDAHGLLANNTAILEDPLASAGDPSRCVVEGHLEHSKTKFARTLNLAGKTITTGIGAAGILADYWDRAGFRIVRYEQAGIWVKRPDYWTIRVSLLGMDERELERLLATLDSSGVPAVRTALKSTGQEALRRYKIKGAAGLQKAYVNVISGSSLDKDLDEVKDLLLHEGFRAQKVPGPLLIATQGGKAPHKRKLMPLSTDTTFEPTKEMLTQAWKLANADPLNPDPHLDVPHGEDPKWTPHSLRRGADTTARRWMEKSGTTEAEIDLYFGWHEKILRKAMQVHYASLSIRERMTQSKITGWM